MAKTLLHVRAGPSELVTAGRAAPHPPGPTLSDPGSPWRGRSSVGATSIRRCKYHPDARVTTGQRAGIGQRHQDRPCLARASGREGGASDPEAAGLDGRRWTIDRRFAAFWTAPDRGSTSPPKPIPARSRAGATRLRSRAAASRMVSSDPTRGDRPDAARRWGNPQGPPATALDAAQALRRTPCGPHLG